MAIPVDQLPQVTTARCLSCLSCVDACRQDETRAISWGPPIGLGRRWPQSAAVIVLLLCTAGAVSAAYFHPLPSYVKAKGTPTETVATLDLQIENLTCRGRANLCFWFLERDDLHALDGYLQLEAWPGPGAARARITYDPSLTDAEKIKRAISEPYFEPGGSLAESRWRASPFRILGYDAGLP